VIQDCFWEAALGVKDRLVLSDDQWEAMSGLIIGRPDQRGSTGRDNRIEPNEEQSVCHRQPRLRGHAPKKHIQLMSQQNDLGFQSCLRFEWRDQNVREQDQEPDHCSSA
jgi:hypothetical protein